MTSKLIGRVRLFLGATALLGAQGVAAGLLSTVDTLQDFYLDGGRTADGPAYQPPGADISSSGDAVPVRAGDEMLGVEQDFAQIQAQDLYLTPRLRGSSALASDEFQLSPRPSQSSDTSALLEGSLRQIQVDGNPGDFLFLVKENGVDSALADQYRRSGLSVPVRVADLDGTGLTNAYGAPADKIVLDQAHGQAPSPGIPAPGTLPLLLAVIPWIVVWRRGRSTRKRRPEPGE